MLAAAQDRQPLDVKFEAATPMPLTPMPLTRKADVNAVTAAFAAALAENDKPAG